MDHILLILIIALAADLLFGDPLGSFHVVVAMGRLISALERLMRRIFPESERGEFWGGVCTVVLVCAAVLVGSAALLRLAYALHAALGFLLECFLGWQCLAAHSLCRESTAVRKALLGGSIKKARAAVGRIVGRDTDALDPSGVARAAVETVAENCSDGVVAPLLFMSIGGAPLALMYKAINTMDSMLGYKNARYINFGRAAAKLDDAANFIPSRLAGLAMVAAAAVLRMDARAALRIFRRDRLNHPSPNSAHTEAACAGALGLRLGGPGIYFGKAVDKPYIGDDTRPIEPEDIARANRLMLVSSGFCFLLFAILRGVALC